MALCMTTFPTATRADTVINPSPVMVSSPTSNLVMNKNFVVRWDGDKKQKYTIILVNENGTKAGIIKESVEGNSYKWKIGKLKKEKSDGSGFDPEEIKIGSYYQIVVVNKKWGPIEGDKASEFFMIEKKKSKPIGIIPSSRSNDTKTADAKIKAILLTQRVQAELYYETVGSYLGFCSSSQYLNITYSAVELAGSKPTCFDYKLSYAISLPLVSESSKWCVDSTGKNSKGRAVKSSDNAKCSL